MSFRRSTNATHQTVASEAISIDLNTGSYYSLNETGTWLVGNISTANALSASPPWIWLSPATSPTMLA